MTNICKLNDIYIETTKDLELETSVSEVAENIKNAVIESHINKGGRLEGLLSNIRVKLENEIVYHGNNKLPKNKLKEYNRQIDEKLNNIGLEREQDGPYGPYEQYGRYRIYSFELRHDYMTEMGKTESVFSKELRKQYYVKREFQRDKWDLVKEDVMNNLQEHFEKLAREGEYSFEIYKDIILMYSNKESADILVDMNERFICEFIKEELVKGGFTDIKDEWTNIKVSWATLGGNMTKVAKRT